MTYQSSTQHNDTTYTNFCDPAEIRGTKYAMRHACLVYISTLKQEMYETCQMYKYYLYTEAEKINIQ